MVGVTLTLRRLYVTRAAAQDTRDYVYHVCIKYRVCARLALGNSQACYTTRQQAREARAGW